MLSVRVVRGEVLALRNREYVQAAVATGAAVGRIILRHVLPNVTTPLIVISDYIIARPADVVSLVTSVASA